MGATETHTHTHTHTQREREREREREGGGEGGREGETLTVHLGHACRWVTLLAQNQGMDK